MESKANTVKTNNGYFTTKKDVDVAIKVQQIMSKILTSRKLNTERNRNRYKEIAKIVKNKSLLVHARIGVFSMDVIASRDKKGEGYYVISLRTDNTLFFNNNGVVSTYSINNAMYRR
ncbi:hypothetical protein F-liban_433 [Faustovirus]|nr:hypothetical protein F-liban_433 [Faustovirus]SME65124.1 Hypothetical protein FSTVST1_423 [Faustovirus ST1]